MKFDLSKIKLNEELAEMMGAIIGDGCLLKFTCSNGRKVREVLFTGHIRNDYEYYEETIRPIVQKHFGINGYLQKRHDVNCVYYRVRGGAFDFFNKFNLPVGKKKNLKIPKEIMQNKLFAKACLRGIFNTDGTIYCRYSKRYKNHSKLYDYLVIAIKMFHKEIISQIKRILDQNGITSNRITKSKNCFETRITKQEDIKKFMETIKPSNKYHVERYKTRCKKMGSKGLSLQKASSNP